MSTNTVEYLLDQIVIIQEVLKKYHIRETKIFGSQLYGTNHEFSDFDVAIMADHIRDEVEKIPGLLANGNTAENFTRTVLDEAGVILCHRLNRDVNLDVNFEKKEYEESDILELGLPILKNGKRVRSDVLARSIVKIRRNPSRFPKEIRDSYQQQFYLIANVSRLCFTARFYSYIKTLEDFLHPKKIQEKSMRNQIINALANFSGVIEKVDREIVESAGFSFSTFLSIKEIVKSKQRLHKNYNSIALGWEVCGSGDLSVEELLRFGQLYLGLKEILLDILKNNKEHEQIAHVYFIFQNALRNPQENHGSIHADYCLIL